MSTKQYLVLLFVVFFGFVGVALPYPIMAPLFLGEHTQAHIHGLSPNMLFGIVLAVYPIGQFLGAPVLGSMSDQYGRKKLLIFSTFGTSIGYLFSAVAILLNSITLLIISRFVTGVLEGNIGIAQACISDSGINKHKGMGAISACSHLGYLFGPVLGGLLADNSIVSWFNYAVPFMFASVLSLALVGLLCFIFQEPNKATKEHDDIISNEKSISEHFNLIGKVKRIATNQRLFSFLALIILISLSVDCYYEFYPAFLVQQWDASPSHIAYYTIALSSCLGLGGYVLTQILGKIFTNTKYLFALIVGYGLSLTILLFAQNIFLLVLHFVLTGLLYGALNTTQMVRLSNQAQPHEQGEVMGLQSGFRMLGDGIVCIVGALVLTISSSTPIMLAVGFAVCGLIYYIASGQHNHTAGHNFAGSA